MWNLFLTKLVSAQHVLFYTLKMNAELGTVHKWCHFFWGEALWFGMYQFRKMGSLNKDPFLLHFIKILCIQGMLHKFLAPKSHSGCLDISLKKSNLVKNGHFWRFLGFNFGLSPWYQMVLWGCIYGTKTHLFDQ